MKRHIIELIKTIRKYYNTKITYYNMESEIQTNNRDMYSLLGFLKEKYFEEHRCDILCISQKLRYRYKVKIESSASVVFGELERLYEIEKQYKIQCNTRKILTEKI